jgi:hypothetical protein
MHAAIMKAAPKYIIYGRIKYKMQMTKATIIKHTYINQQTNALNTLQLVKNGSMLVLCLEFTYWSVAPKANTSNQAGISQKRT